MCSKKSLVVTWSQITDYSFQCIANIQMILVKDNLAMAMVSVAQESKARVCITHSDFAYQHCCWPTPQKIRETQGYVARILLSSSVLQRHQ